MKCSPNVYFLLCPPNVEYRKRKGHCNKIIMVHSNINSHKNKFAMLANSVTEHVDVIQVSETTFDDTLLYVLHHLKNFSNPYRLDRYADGIEILVYERKKISI